MLNTETTQNGYGPFSKAVRIQNPLLHESIKVYKEWYPLSAQEKTVLVKRKSGFSCRSYQFSYITNIMKYTCKGTAVSSTCNDKRLVSRIYKNSYSSRRKRSLEKQAKDTVAA